MFLSQFLPVQMLPSWVGIVGPHGNDTTSYSYLTGFERELQELLRYFDNNNIKNIVFVTTDVHFPTNIRYEVDANNDGDKLTFREIISGPLSAFRFSTPGGVCSYSSARYYF